MSVSIEVEVEPEEKCNGMCMCGGQARPDMPNQPTKDELLTKLKTLIADPSANGRAERQLEIDKLMKEIIDMGDSGD